MKKYLLIFINLLIAFNAICQLHPEYKRTWNWYFGYGVGLNFSSGNMVLNNIADPYFPGLGYSNVTISDTSGNLLLYSSDGILYDKNLNGIAPIANGMYGSLILPVPHKDSIFILFKTTGDPTQANFETVYSLININQNNGLGGVYQTNTPFLSHSGGGIVAAYHKNNNDFWIVAADTNGFIHSWLLDSTLTLPLVSSSPVTTVKSLYNETIGHIIPTITPKPSADLIALSCGGRQSTHSSYTFSLLNFDNSTGSFSNDILIESTYALCTNGNFISQFECFSPQGKYIYAPFIECPPAAPRNGYIKRYTNLYGITSANDIQTDTVFISTTGEAPYTIMYTPINTMLFFNINDSNSSSLNNPYLSQILYPDSSNPLVLTNSIYSGKICTWAPLNNLPAAWYYRPSGYLNIPELNNEPLVVFPNPANDKIYLLNLYQPVENVIIYDLLGKSYFLPFTKEGQINTATLNNGIYFIKIILANGIIKTTKIIVKH